MPEPEDWLESNTRRPLPFQGAELSRRRQLGAMRLGVVLSARDDASTLGKHLLALRHGWPGGDCPWCEIAVVDLGSTDATADIARAQEARLLGGEPVLPTEPPPEALALRRAVDQLGCEVVLMVPASLRRVDWDMVSGLVLSLLDHPEAVLAVGFEEEPHVFSRLSLRPLLAVLEPSLAYLADPACPIVAVRTEGVRDLPMALTSGYEPSLALEVHRRLGLSGICQAPVGTLLWNGSGRRFGEDVAFRSVLALLETARRHGLLSREQEFGHLFTSLSSPGEGMRLQTRLQLFRWSLPEG
jgi:glucosyl-3-phosphoglycerate synthase